MLQTESPVTGREARELIRAGGIHHPTSELAPGFVQTNLAILPLELAFDFLLFCQRNPKACPLIEVMEAGRHEPTLSAPGADIRTDLTRYSIYRDGTLTEEVDDLLSIWREDFVSFLTGCSFSFEQALIKNGIDLPHRGTNKNVAMFRTNIATIHAGQFRGPMVVSMRWIPRDKIVKAVQATSRFPSVHGAPVHIGEPEVIGIQDVTKPDYGHAWPAKPGDVPVFWACGVTVQAVAMASRPSIMITHATGHMFVTDFKDEDVAVL